MSTITSNAASGSLPRETRISIGFLNWAHALDHYVMLIFPTVVIGLEAVYGRSYSELIVLATASFVSFGVFSLPAGWLAPAVAALRPDAGSGARDLRRQRRRELHRL